MKELYTIKEAAEVLGFKERTIRAWVYDNKIKYVKVFNNVRIPKEEIERLKKGE